MEFRWDIFGIGTVAVDDLLIVDHFPLPDTKMPVRRTLRQSGGQTATALVAASRHGARTAFCACLDDDDLSQFALRALVAEGVDCSSIFHVSGCRPVHSVIIVEPAAGSRTILYNTQDVQEPSPDDINPEWVTQSRVLFFDQNAPRAGLYAARLAKKAGIPVIADLEKLGLPEMDAILSNIDHLIISLPFAINFTGQKTIADMMAAFSAPWRAATVITCGADGCWFTKGSDSARHFPAFPVEVIDTTGCGDVFHGAYAAAIARGEDVQQAVAVASAAAAIKATLPGGRAGIPDLTEARRLVQER